MWLRNIWRVIPEKTRPVYWVDPPRGKKIFKELLLHYKNDADDH